MALKLPVAAHGGEQRYRRFFGTLFCALFTLGLLFLTAVSTNLKSSSRSVYSKIQLGNVLKLPEELVGRLSIDQSSPRNTQCTHWDCFDVYKCGHAKISIYVYPLRKYVDENGVPATEPMSRQFYELLETVLESEYYTPDPYKACLFLPSIDTLNQDRVRLNLTSKALSTLPFWNGGTNHIIFNMVSGSSPDYSPVLELDLGKALVAGANFDTFSFRDNYDIAIPVYSPVAKLAQQHSTTNRQRRWLLTSSQLNIDPYFLGELQKLSYLHHNSLLILDACQHHNYTHRCEIITGTKYNYPQILAESTFCLVFRGERTGQSVLMDILASGCIPVFVSDGIVLPFGQLIDWRRSAVFIMENYLSSILDVLNTLSKNRVQEMRSSVKMIYAQYFTSMQRIVATTLDIIQERIYPHSVAKLKAENTYSEDLGNPLFFPITAPKSHGFTAVILTYDRVESLFILIDRLSRVPSLMKVIVVWNNQKKNPPTIASFPKIAKPIKLIRTKANKLSNRFYPYKEIETEAVLHIDDDIVMLTSDEVEFAYEVWREFPDRLVGFPSRTHIWDNATHSWKYESEWTNEISMVLTGAAFLHKYWSYLYTKGMPSNLKDWVDDHMNCEDIAMNFLVANVTNKPPIKVTPRKKFKCPECTNNENLSADLGHMVERTQCINRFAKAFGRMPLKSVEFRADPVLFKDPFPEKLKRFNDIGSL